MVLIQSVSSGRSFHCVLFSNGNVKCFGLGENGRLGYGDTIKRGDNANEMGDKLPYLDFGTSLSVKKIASGRSFSCVSFDSQDSIKCWGSGYNLGYGKLNDIGDEPNEMGDNLPFVDIGTGKRVIDFITSTGNTCILLDDAKVRCYGGGSYGILGRGNKDSVGYSPFDMGDNLTAIDFGTGTTVTSLYSGPTANHVCVKLDNNKFKCWGANSSGQLGIGDTNWRGDTPNEMGDNLPYLDIGTGRTIKQLSLGSSHTCALFDDDLARCWGANSEGQLGIASDVKFIKDSAEMGDALKPMQLGTSRTVKIVVAMDAYTCATLDDNSLKCVGVNDFGKLGLGDTDSRGVSNITVGDYLPSVDLGTGLEITHVSGFVSTCVVFVNQYIKCFGQGFSGQLGLEESMNGDYADEVNRGDDASDMGSSLPFVDLGITTGLTFSPTTSPTKYPSKAPTASPSKKPSRSPSKTPTKNPINPTTKTPSISPTTNPTTSTSKTPTKAPTLKTSSPSASSADKMLKFSYEACLVLILSMLIMI